MGFSTSGAALILFLGILVSASVLVPAVERTVEAVTDAEADRNDRLLDRQNAAIAVRNVTYDEAAPAVTVEVTNVGATTLSVDRTDLLLNGTLRTGYETSVDGVLGRSIWAPGETLTFEVADPDGRPVRVEVVTEHGVKRLSTDVTVVT